MHFKLNLFEGPATEASPGRGGRHGGGEEGGGGKASEVLCPSVPVSLSVWAVNLCSLPLQEVFFFEIENILYWSSQLIDKWKAWNAITQMEFDWIAYQRM